MTDLVAYRFKQKAADGYHETRWTEWRSGRLRAEMMKELRSIGEALTIAQCCTPRAEIDPINGRENDLWQWTRQRGWQLSNRSNWFVDSCDPTDRNDIIDEDPFSAPPTIEDLKDADKQTQGIQHITDAITVHEMIYG